MADRKTLSDFSRLVGANDRSVLGGDGGPPHDPGMELLTARVETLEKRMERIETRLDGIDGRLRGVETTLSAIDGKIGLIVAQMPRWWQAPLSAGALVTLILSLLGLATHFRLVG